MGSREHLLTDWQQFAVPITHGQDGVMSLCPNPPIGEIGGD